MKGSLFRASSLSVLVLLLALPWSGCETASDPEQGEAGAGGLGAAPDFDQVSKKVIGSEGGTIKIEGAELDVPEGALSEEVELQLGRLTPRAQDSLALPPAGVDYAGRAFAFEPHGLNFERPVGIRLDYSDVGHPVVGRLSDARDTEWARGDRGDASFDGGRSSFTVDSFSIYSIVDDPGGLLSQGDEPSAGGAGGMGTGGIDAGGAGGAEPGFGGAGGAGAALECLSPGGAIFPIGTGSCLNPFDITTTFLPLGVAQTHSTSTSSNDYDSGGCFLGLRTAYYTVDVQPGEAVTVTAHPMAGFDVQLKAIASDCLSAELVCANEGGVDDCEVLRVQEGVDFSGASFSFVVSSDSPGGSFEITMLKE